MNATRCTLDDFDAMTFDCYGTLIDWERGILDALEPWRRRHDLVLSGDDLLALYAQSEPKHEAATPAKPYPEILKHVLADVARSLDVDALDDELTAFSRSVRDWPAFPDSPDALRLLKQHYKLVVVSNVDRGSFAYSNAKLGVEFDLIVTAEDVGSYKPDPRHFEFALESLGEMGVPPERVLHVAQSLYHDHVPAKALGLHTAWINRRAGKPGSGAAPPPAPAVHPDIIVDNLAALVEMRGAGSP